MDNTKLDFAIVHMETPKKWVAGEGTLLRWVGDNWQKKPMALSFSNGGYSPYWEPCSLFIVDKSKPYEVGGFVLHKGSMGDIYFQNVGRPHTFVDVIKGIEGEYAICERFEFKMDSSFVYPVVASSSPLYKIPQISQEFLNKFVEFRGKIELENFLQDGDSK